MEALCTEYAQQCRTAEVSWKREKNAHSSLHVQSQGVRDQLQPVHNWLQRPHNHSVVRSESCLTVVAHMGCARSARIVQRVQRTPLELTGWLKHSCWPCTSYIVLTGAKWIDCMLVDNDGSPLVCWCWPARRSHVAVAAPGTSQSGTCWRSRSSSRTTSV